MNEWEGLVLWFDLVKKSIDVELYDHFTIVKNNIQPKGDLLKESMQNFWRSEGVNSLSNISSQYDLKNMSKRMKLKTHLVNMLHKNRN